MDLKLRITNSVYVAETKEARDDYPASQIFYAYPEEGLTIRFGKKNAASPARLLDLTFDRKLWKIYEASEYIKTFVIELIPNNDPDALVPLCETIVNTAFGYVLIYRKGEMEMSPISSQIEEMDRYRPDFLKDGYDIESFLFFPSYPARPLFSFTSDPKTHYYLAKKRPIGELINIIRFYKMEEYLNNCLKYNDIGFYCSEDMGHLSYQGDKLYLYLEDPFEPVSNPIQTAIEMNPKFITHPDCPGIDKEMNIGIVETEESTFFFPIRDDADQEDVVNKFYAYFLEEAHIDSILKLGKAFNTSIKLAVQKKDSPKINIQGFHLRDK